MLCQNLLLHKYYKQNVFRMLCVEVVLIQYIHLYVFFPNSLEKYYNRCHIGPNHLFQQTSTRNSIRHIVEFLVDVQQSYFSATRRLVEFPSKCLLCTRRLVEAIFLLLGVQQENSTRCPVETFYQTSSRNRRFGGFSGYFFISFDKITFYIEILSCKDDFFLFFSLVSLMTKDQKTKFHAKISVWNYIFDSRQVHILQF